ncbi:unknown [Cryptophlebia leucotreta granulovirus]|uniref:Uncharacterized protein n=1 Tax=Cryptophlebia leucotreta granulosis virus TaxID=35254 RepID=Q7T5R6_GVCL|nr:hypothetical protein [Cryptophlebia leucotreta granulovirus]AAQ21618.1 unknown [Cryptophlebia leucotreta granulovirus]
MFSVSEKEFFQIQYMDETKLAEYLSCNIVDLNNDHFNFIFNCNIDDVLDDFDLIENFANVNVKQAYNDGVILFTNNDDCVYEIKNANDLKYKIKNVNNSLCVVDNNFLLNRYFLEIQMIGDNMYEKRGKSIRKIPFIIVNYYFLDISISVDKKLSRQEVTLFGGARTLHVNHLLTDQIHAIIVSLFQNNCFKINKRMKRIFRIIKSVKGFNITKDNTEYYNSLIKKGDRILLSMLREHIYRLGPYHTLTWVLFLIDNDLIVRNTQTFCFYKLSDVHVSNIDRHYQNIKSKLTFLYIKLHNYNIKCKRIK